MRVSLVFLVGVAAPDAGLAGLRFVASGVIGGDSKPVESAGMACAGVSVVTGVDSRTAVAMADALVIIGVGEGSEVAVVVRPGVVPAAVVVVAAADRSERNTESIQYCSHADKGPTV